MGNETRWSGTFNIINRFVRIRKELIDVSNKDNSHLTIDKTVKFANKAKR